LAHNTLKTIILTQKDNELSRAFSFICIKFNFQSLLTITSNFLKPFQHFVFLSIYYYSYPVLNRRILHIVKCIESFSPIFW